VKNRFFEPISYAFSTLTCIPVAPHRGSLENLKRSVAFYPLVGLAIGTFLAWVGKMNSSSDLKAILILLLWVVLTSAFHLDGLADCSDGFFGGHTPKERRRIMKDAAVGVYGLTAVVLILMIKFVLLSHLLNKLEGFQELITIPVLARWAVCFSSYIFRAPAGDKGLGSQMVGLTFQWFFFSTSMTLLLCGFLLRLNVLGAFLAAILVSVGVGRFSKARIGGLTGDGMGATIELAETALLVLFLFF